MSKKIKIFELAESEESINSVLKINSEEEVKAIHAEKEFLKEEQRRISTYYELRNDIEQFDSPIEDISKGEPFFSLLTWIK